MIYAHTRQFQTSLLKPVWSVCYTKISGTRGRVVTFHQLENKMSFFLFRGLARKVLGLGVLGLKYHVLGMKMVVSDQSNWS